MEPDQPFQPVRTPENLGPLMVPDGSSELDIRKQMELMQEYRAAIREITARCEIIADDARLRLQHNPIHGISSRLKSPASMLEKLRRKGLPPTTDNIRANVRDVAGVRVVCNYLDDVGIVASTLLAQSDIELVDRKDYVQKPKESGYRSLHLVVGVPVFLNGSQRTVAVEVQVRTLAMDFWASLEHRLRYKNRAVLAANGSQVEDIRARLVSCAHQIADLDRAMQQIQRDIDALRVEQEETLARSGDMQP